MGTLKLNTEGWSQHSAIELVFVISLEPTAWIGLFSFLISAHFLRKAAS